jgi:AraC-like DNA-binding protein
MNLASGPEMHSIESLRSYVEGYPEGGRIPKHAHDWDQIALISESAAIVETDAVYVVHPLLKGLWLPAGVEHSIYSPRRFRLHTLYFEPGTLRTDSEPQVLGLDDLARELILFLCTATRASERTSRHSHALALLEQVLPEARPESFSLPRPKHERARLLADHFSTKPGDSRPVELIAAEVGGASLRTFERIFADETGLSLAAWRRHSRLLTSLSLLTEGRSIGEIACAVGYDSAAAFSTAFKQCFGVSPSNYG